MIAMFSEKLRVEHIEHLVYVKGLFVLKCFIIEGNNFIRKQHIERLWVCSVVMLFFHLCLMILYDGVEIYIHIYILVGGRWLVSDLPLRLRERECERELDNWNRSYNEKIRINSNVMFFPLILKIQAIFFNNFYNECD